MRKLQLLLLWVVQLSVLKLDAFPPDPYQPDSQSPAITIGSNGGDPSETPFPLRYEVDYIRVYQKD